MAHHKNDTLFFIPTYKEAENVRIIYNLLRCLPDQHRFDILFVDDNSPDGTGEILEELKAKDPSLFVVHRKEKSGIGSAHKAGIRWAYDGGYSTLVTMDCDLTHTPEDALRFIELGKIKSVVVGSRFLQEGSLSTWNIMRKFLTRFGHFLTVVLLDLPYDSSGAFRLYNLRQIPREAFERVQSDSYSFFFESLLLLHVNRISIGEVPINLPKRTYGNSKMSFRDIATSIRFLFTMFYRKKFDRQSMVVTPAK